MNKLSISKNNFYYPPGGILIWIILAVEVLTFMLAIISLMYNRGLNLNLFTEFQQSLDVTEATANTILLITSGYFMANTVSALKNNLHKKANVYILISIVLGFGFLILKSVEYYHKIDLGLTLRTNTFYSYYWLITGFHFLHVVMGLVILIAIKPAIKKKKYAKDNMFDVETAATFWHMCDVIWILIFPVFYLMN